MIGGKTGKRQQENLRSELERHHHPDSGGVVVGQLGEDDPVLGRALHPRAHVGHERPAGPHPVVEAPERTEGAIHRSFRSSMISCVVPVSPRRGKMRVMLFW